MQNPPLTRDALIAEFQGYGRPYEGWLIGAELERHMLLPSGAPLPYSGPGGIRSLLESLAERFGWTLEHEGEYPIAARRGGAWVTLEPGSQLELSGAPFDNVQEVADEAWAFSEEVSQIVGEGVDQVALGFTPFAAIGDIGWVPKGRYVVMREHLGATGTLAHHMMKGTCAVQASYDYADEADCARKVALATRLAPLTTALFAHSPLSEGRPNGFMSYRGHIWTQTDPARTGLPDAAHQFTFERWVDYLLHAPMMFVKDAAGAYVPARGRTFAQWMDSDDPPDHDAWDLHMTSVFPEVRVKRTIEVRGADCVPLPLAYGFIALFKGLFYCNLALRAAEGLSHELASHGTRMERFEAACRDGLHARVGGRRLVEWAEELLQLSLDALERCAPDDRRWLAPLVAQVERGESPARTLLRELGSDITPERVARLAHVRAGAEQG